ncbi:MAG: hypothetical protein H6709_08035 [Kofleriaceae bacterium]|nr:hypothetical protein [Kofleriaceae bacterium]
MPRTIRIGVIYALAMLVVAVALLLGFGAFDDPFAASPSPDGARAAAPAVHGGSRVEIEIRRADGSLEAALDTGACDVAPWAMAWHDPRTLVVSSADAGARAWRRGDDGWHEITMTPELAATAATAYAAKHGPARA